jgi:hypothetical protein
MHAHYAAAPSTTSRYACCPSTLTSGHLLTNDWLQHCRAIPWTVLQDAFQLADAEYGRHQLLRASGGAPVILAVGTGLMVPGYTLIVDEAGAPDLYARLINKVCTGCCSQCCMWCVVCGEVNFRLSP